MKKLILLLSASAALVVIFGTIYAVGQQIQRGDANWPQVQLAEDTAFSLNQGRLPDSTVNSKVDIVNSLSTFVNVYDNNGKPIFGTGYLGSDIAVPPKGVLAAADNKTYSTVTWQPQNNVRIATVSIRAGNFYVVSGRSLAEVEKNSARTFMLSFVGGVITLFVVIIAFWVNSLVARKAARRK